uniref:VP11 n=1 Tax=viral metagenome TaxID=1070528 RepID=A0A2V0RBY7_9ZZZZ
MEGESEEFIVPPHEMDEVGGDVELGVQPSKHPRRGSLVAINRSTEWEAGQERLDCYMREVQWLYERMAICYRSYERSQTWIEIPIIIFSSFVSVLVAGGSSYIPIMVLDVIIVGLSVSVTILQSIRTFFQIDKKKEVYGEALNTCDRLALRIGKLYSVYNSEVNRGVKPSMTLKDIDDELELEMHTLLKLQPESPSVITSLRDRPMVSSHALKGAKLKEPSSSCCGCSHDPDTS